MTAAPASIGRINSLPGARNDDIACLPVLAKRMDGRRVRAEESRIAGCLQGVEGIGNRAARAASRSNSVEIVMLELTQDRKSEE